jgi:hypothetical protein
MVESFGNNLVGEADGLYEIQFGPEALVALATLLAPVWVDEALSFCSHE